MVAVEDVGDESATSGSGSARPDEWIGSAVNRRGQKAGAETRQTADCAFNRLSLSNCV